MPPGVSVAWADVNGQDPLEAEHDADQDRGCREREVDQDEIGDGDADDAGREKNSGKGGQRVLPHVAKPEVEKGPALRGKGEVVGGFGHERRRQHGAADHRQQADDGGDDRHRDPGIAENLTQRGDRAGHAPAFLHDGAEEQHQFEGDHKLQGFGVHHPSPDGIAHRRDGKVEEKPQDGGAGDQRDAQGDPDADQDDDRDDNEADFDQIDHRRRP